jgi:tetratricopeptide (TPR) repeat protein
MKCSDVHLSIGTIHQKMKHFEDAIDHFNKSYLLKKSVLPKNSVELIVPLNSLALTETYRGNHMKAIQRYIETLAINK